MIYENVDKRERENERFKINGMFDNGGADKDSVYEHASGRVGIFSRVRQSRGQASKHTSTRSYLQRAVYTMRPYTTNISEVGQRRADTYSLSAVPFGQYQTGPHGDCSSLCASVQIYHRQLLRNALSCWSVLTPKKPLLLPLPPTWTHSNLHRSSPPYRITSVHLT
jgi:hypothetical protein